MARMTGMGRGEERLDARQRVVDVDRVDRCVAEIGAVAQREGIDAARPVDVAHQRRQVAQLARAVARAGAIGGAAVPGNAGQSDLDRVEQRVALLDPGQAHEGGDAGEAWHDGARGRGETLVHGEAVSCAPVNSARGRCRRQGS
jgi:hypothetical protein